jgi:hypothetical protein
MEKIMRKTNDTTTINTVAEAAIGSGTVLDDAELHEVSGGWCELGGLTGTPTTGAGALVDALKTNLSQVRGPTKNP